MKTLPIALSVLLLSACAAFAPARDPNVGTVSSAAPSLAQPGPRAG